MIQPEIQVLTSNKKLATDFANPNDSNQDCAYVLVSVPLSM